MSVSIDRISKALEYAGRYGQIDGAHHKMWVIDQMVRALLGVPEATFTGTDARGEFYEFEAQTSNESYAAFVREYCDGEDGPETYAWDIGIPP